MATVVVGGLSMAGSSLVLPLHNRLWPAAHPARDAALFGVRLDFVAGLLDLLALAGCLGLALAMRHRFGGESRWLAFVALSWLGVLPLKAGLVLALTGWPWDPSHLGSMSPATERYCGDLGTVIALGASAAIAFLFIGFSGRLFPRLSDRPEAAQRPADIGAGAR